MVANAVDSFVYLRPAIALVLGFIGLKLIGSFVRSMTFELVPQMRVC